MLFHPLPAPRDEDLRAWARCVPKVTRYLGQLTEKGQQLTLDHLANASVQAWSDWSRVDAVLRLGSTARMPRPAIIGKRCAEVAGSMCMPNGAREGQ